MDKDNYAEKCNNGNKVLHYSLWQRTFIIISGIIELAVLVPITIFALVFGYHGFISGEMGNMIGMFAIAVLLLLFPYSAARIIAVYGIWKRKKWGAVVTIVLALLIITAMFIPPLEFSALYIGLLLYGFLLMWAGVKCYTANTKKHTGS